MVTFIDQHRETYRVEAICARLPIARSTYFLRCAQQDNPTKRSARVQRDAELRGAIQRAWDENDQLYGRERSGANCGVKGAAWRAAPSSG